MSKHSEIPEDILERARKWPKEFESHSLTGDEKGEVDSNKCDLPSK